MFIISPSFTPALIWFVNETLTSLCKLKSRQIFSQGDTGTCICKLIIRSTKMIIHYLDPFARTKFHMSNVINNWKSAWYDRMLAWNYLDETNTELEAGKFTRLIIQISNMWVFLCHHMYRTWIFFLTYSTQKTIKCHQSTVFKNNFLHEQAKLYADKNVVACE